MRDEKDFPIASIKFLIKLKFSDSRPKISDRALKFSDSLPRISDRPLKFSDSGPRISDRVLMFSDSRPRTSHRELIHYQILDFIHVPPPSYIGCTRSGGFDFVERV